MTRPPTLAEASARALLADAGQGIHTFSNGTEWECWADPNCLTCWHWNPECAGEGCAFEGAALLDMVSPDLARLFGWIQDPEYADYVGPSDPPGSHRHGWDAPQACPFFRDRTNDDGGDNPPPPDPDPQQLVLLADPTEDLALVQLSPAAELVGVRA